MLSESSTTVVSLRRSRIVRPLTQERRRRFFKHDEGYPGFTLNFVFQKHPKFLDQIEDLIYKAHKNRTEKYEAIVRVFEKARNEIFVDSKGRFGVAARWEQIYNIDDVDIDAIRRHFPLNPYAAKAVLLEMALVWASGKLASKEPSVLMEDKTAIATAEAVISNRELLAAFIGGRYRVNPGQAAMLLARVQRIAESLHNAYSKTQSL